MLIDQIKKYCDLNKHLNISIDVYAIGETENNY